MGGWRLESFKMLGYLFFPIGAFVWFNHPNFYERSMKQAMENMSTSINLDNVAKIQQMANREEIDKLDTLIDELDDKKKSV